MQSYKLYPTTGPVCLMQMLIENRSNLHWACQVKFLRDHIHSNFMISTYCAGNSPLFWLATSQLVHEFKPQAVYKSIQRGLQYLENCKLSDYKIISETCLPTCTTRNSNKSIHLYLEFPQEKMKPTWLTYWIQTSI